MDANASRLDVASALDLLTQSGITSEFEDFFRYASELDISVDAIAATVLGRLLNGTLGELVSGAACVAFASLQEHARRAADVLRDMGRQPVALAWSAHEPGTRESLGKRSDAGVLERLARIPDLVQRIELAIGRSEDRLRMAAYRSCPPSGRSDLVAPGDPEGLSAAALPAPLTHVARRWVS